MPLPMLTPLTCHWYCGAVPLFAAVGVKVTGMPAQTGSADAEMVTEGTDQELTDRVTKLEVAVTLLAQVELLVRTQETLSPLARVLLV